ncbi:MAG: sulfotransferase family protein, partial [Bacteroidetes bacterium]|nr:sulfotransferase family protein [Bacteroidota bacterium]
MQKCIFILGMHRSGTSAITGVLKILGVNLGSSLMPPLEDNPKGYFENLNVFKVNEEILGSINSSWDN